MKIIRWVLLFSVLLKRNIKWLFIKLSSKDNEIVRNINGSKMVLYTSRKGLDFKEKCIFKQLALDAGREFEATKIIKEVLKPGDIIFELGANIGYYSLLESKLIKETGKIFAIEPELENFNLLKRNIDLNNIKNVEVFNIAISNENGNSKFYVTKDSNLHSMYKPRSGDYKEVIIETRTVDKFLENKGKINFLRMDIEGYEYQALKGMQETLKNNKDLSLFIELHTSRVGMKKARELLNNLKSYNFEIFALITHDNFLRKKLGMTTVEKITINELLIDPRFINEECAFEIFFKK